jgi:hypothetical protein
LWLGQHKDGANLSLHFTNLGLRTQKWGKPFNEKPSSMYVKRIALAAAVLCGCATIAVRERSVRSPSALLNNGVSADGLPILSKGLDYIPLQDAGAMGTNRAFLSHADGEGTGQRGPAGFGTNAAFLNKGDGTGQSTKALRTQKLYAWVRSLANPNLANFAPVHRRREADVAAC